MPVALISNSDCGRHDTGWGHPEHVGRLRAIPTALRNDPELYQALLQVEGRHATAAELALVHGADYVASIERAAEEAAAADTVMHLDPDTVVSGGSWDAGTAAAGCVMDAVDMAADGRAIRSFCAVRPPGHHAVRDRAMGFCLFGSVALAARWARVHHGIDRVLIVDWDVHHGNGTQALVEADTGIHYVSMHQWPWYPGTGAAADRGPLGTVWNVPLAGGLARAQSRERSSAPSIGPWRDSPRTSSSSRPGSIRCEGTRWGALRSRSKTLVSSRTSSGSGPSSGVRGEW
jgi:acetoin utilization deacetylase AcuC-like enzyme